MNRRWCEESVEFAASVRGELERLGAVDLARRAEADPAVRAEELAPALQALGFEEVNLFGDGTDAEIAAAAARAAGSLVMPWPVAPRLAVPPELREQIDGLYLSAQAAPRRLEHLDLMTNPVAVDLRSGEASTLAAGGAVRHMPLDPFGVDCTASGPLQAVLGAEQTRRMIDAHAILSSFYVLGALDKVTELAAAYAIERVQFNQPIIRFGGIQWRLSDIVLAKTGLSELAAFTLYRFTRGTATAADSLALRYTMLDAAGTVLSNAHQVFGAIGLCEEHDLTVIDRHLQPILRRPVGIAATSLLLLDAIEEHGFDGVFPVQPVEAALAGAAT
jgi:acyl-CoA dehydrogenase-like protein